MTHWKIYVVLILLSAFPLSTFGQTTDCSSIPGTRPATADDAAVKNGQIKLGTCYNPNDKSVGTTPEEAKQYLNSLPKRPLSQCAPPTQQNINALDKVFAVCAAQFLKAYTAQYGTIYITSAFRDNRPGTAGDGSGKSANQCAGGAAASNHSRGFAMDVNPANETLYPQLWKFASDNPQFGVCFPFQDGRTGSIYDRPHMILAGIGGSEGSLCAKQGVTKPCNGQTIDPSTLKTSPVAQTSPTNAFGNTLRNLFGVPQPQQAQQPYSQPLPLQQALNPLNAFQQPIAQPSEPSQPQPRIDTTPFPAIPSGTSGPSIADRLDTFLKQVGYEASTTPITIRSNTTTTIVINPADVAYSGSTTLEATSTPGYTYIATNVGAPQTFTSSDLYQEGLVLESSFADETFLSRIKRILEQLLQALRPFNRPTGGDGTA